MTRPPAASMRAAAAITSTTMNGGTSLRREGVIRPLAASNIGGFLLPRHGKYPRPAVAVFGGFRAASPKGPLRGINLTARAQWAGGFRACSGKAGTGFPNRTCANHGAGQG